MGVLARVKRMANKSRRSPNLDNLPGLDRLVLRDLGSNIPDHRMNTRMNKLGIVFMHNLSLDDRVVLSLLRESRRQKEELAREDDLYKKSVEDCNAWPRIHRSQWEENEIHQDMSGTKKAK